MVAIDMEIPQSCYDCDKKRYCEVGIDGGWRTDIRVEGCPLVEIGTCKDCKQLGVIDCGYYCKLNHWGKISKEGNYGGMGDFYCGDFEKRGNENEIN